MHPPRTVSIPCPAPKDSTPDICVHVLEHILCLAVVRALYANCEYSCCCMPRLQVSHARIRAYAARRHTHTRRERKREPVCALARSSLLMTSHMLGMPHPNLNSQTLDVTYVGHATTREREKRETCRGLGYAPPRPAGCAGQQGPPSERGAEGAHAPRPRLRTP